MYSQNFDFSEFMRKVSDWDVTQIIRAADGEASAAESQLRGRTPRAVRARDWGAREYVAELGQLLYFIRFNARPSGFSDHNYELCQDMRRRLEEKGQKLPVDPDPILYGPLR